MAPRRACYLPRLAAASILAAIALSTVLLRQGATGAGPETAGERDRRASEFADRKGISVAEAREALRGHAETKGPGLYDRNCAECHRYTDPGGTVYGAEGLSAPDLTGLGSPQWIAGWFDEDKIAGPRYFGNTAFKDGSMVDFVQTAFGDICEELVEGEFYQTPREDLIAALAAEAKLDGPHQADADEETVQGLEEDTLFLFEDLSCVDCHRFYHLGSLGDGPDLTGYMSRQWLTGIIKDPSHERFYGSSNDGMPAHYKSPDDHLLTEREIDTLVDWLRGTWRGK